MLMLNICSSHPLERTYFGQSLNCGESTRIRLITKVNQWLNRLGRWNGKKEKIEAGKLPEDFDDLRSFIGISRSAGN